MTERENPQTDENVQDQDAEPSLNAPGDAGPTGVVVEEDPDVEGGTENDADQDAEPSLNAPGDAGPTGVQGGDG